MDVIQEPTEKRLIEKNRLAAIGHMLKDMREERDLKQVDMAVSTGLGQSTISKMEAGQRNLSMTEVDFFAHAMDMDVGSFVKTVLETMFASDARRPDTSLPQDDE